MLRSVLSRRAFSTIRVNGRVYNKPLNSKPVLVINLSGTHRDYFLRARDADLMPNYDRIVMRESFRNTGLVATSMPTLPSTNVASILTGVQSDVHGITGNSYFDESSNRTVVFDQSSQLLCPTILSAFDQAGHRTVFLSVHQSQINLLGGNRTSSQSFSASVESLSSGQVKIPKLDALKAPDARSPDASLFCIDLASKMIEQDLNSAESKAPVYFVSTDDTLQRQHEHGEPQANEFMAKLDNLIGRLDSTGIKFAIVGDHSLNHKMLFSKGKEEINIVYLQPLLEQGKIEGHLSLPIETQSTPSPDSPLGSFAMLYLKDKSKENVMNAMKFLRTHRGIYSTIGKDDACDAFFMPKVRTGDILLIGDRDTVFGRTAGAHNIKAHANAAGRLRSNGSLEEATVPLFLNFSLQPEMSRKLSRGKVRSYDAFQYLLNASTDAPPIEEL